MTQILVTKPGTLNQRDRASLRRAGVVVVEADDLSQVKLIQPSGNELPAHDMLFAAMQAINATGYAADARDAFAKAVLEQMESLRAKADPQ